MTDSASVASRRSRRLIQPDEEPETEEDDVLVARYVVERLLGHCILGGRYLFLVKWKGWEMDKCTYEPVRHLTDDTATYRMLRDYVDEAKIDMDERTGETLHGEEDSPEDEYMEGMRKMKEQGVLPHPPSGIPHFVPVRKIDPNQALEEERGKENRKWVRAETKRHLKEERERKKMERKEQLKREWSSSQFGKPLELPMWKEEGVEVERTEGQREDEEVPAKRCRRDENGFPCSEDVGDDVSMAITNDLEKQEIDQTDDSVVTGIDGSLEGICESVEELSEGIDISIDVPEVGCTEEVYCADLPWDVVVEESGQTTREETREWTIEETQQERDEARDQAIEETQIAREAGNDVVIRENIIDEMAQTRGAGIREMEDSQRNQKMITPSSSRPHRPRRQVHRLCECVMRSDREQKEQQALIKYLKKTATG